jgi:hypothetical protein
LKPVFSAEKPVGIEVNEQDIEREIRAQSVTYYFYQPAPEWYPVEYGSKITLFPPDLPGEPLVAHPVERDGTGRAKMVPANGIAAVKDQYGPVYNPEISKKLIPNQPLQGETANDFFRFVSNEPTHANRGIVRLMNDGKDDLRKAVAKKKYQQTRLAWAEGELQARAEFVTNFNQQPQNKGRKVPSPKASEVAAQEFMDELRSEGKVVVAKYSCEHGCAIETDDFAKYQRHMKVSHDSEVEFTEPVVTTVEAPKNKGGRPRKAEAVA